LCIDTIYVDEQNSILQDSFYERLLAVDNAILIPTNTVINITVTSDDVIHSWAIPQLGVKLDAIPGRVASTSIIAFIEGT